MRQKLYTDKIYISLPSQSEPIEIGPGTVPLSGTSVTKVSIKKLRQSAREVSILGIYDTDNRGALIQN